MKMEHKCEKCNHEQDIEIPGIRRIISHKWFWFRYRAHRVLGSDLFNANIKCDSLWCLRSAAWRINHKDYNDFFFKCGFSCDKHLEKLVPDKTAEITSLRDPKYEKDPPTKEERARLRGIRWRSLLCDVIRLFNPGFNVSACDITLCFRKAIWLVGYRNSESYRAAYVCSTHLKKYSDVFSIHALKDYN